MVRTGLELKPCMDRSQLLCCAAMGQCPALLSRWSGTTYLLRPWESIPCLDICPSSTMLVLFPVHTEWSPALFLLSGMPISTPTPWLCPLKLRSGVTSPKETCDCITCYSSEPQLDSVYIVIISTYGPSAGALQAQGPRPSVHPQHVVLSLTHLRWSSMTIHNGQWPTFC